MYKHALVLFALLVAYVNAWSFTVWSGTKKNGKHCHYFDINTSNNCFNLDSDTVKRGVGSFSYCSMSWARCSITLHSERNCNGRILGSATGNAPFKEWNVDNTSPAASKLQSFRIQGCKEAPIIGTLDCTKCTNDP